MLSITDNANKNAIANSFDWRSAVTDLLNFWTSQNRCFSSGEVAATLRIHRPDLQFKVMSVGEHIKDLFYSNMVPQYPNVGYPLQVPRFTTGKFPQRTPSSTEVFVYGPDPITVMNHDFEIYVPFPGEAIANAPAPAQVVAPQIAPAITLSHKVANSSIVAVVQGDGRLYVSRQAFDLAVHLGVVPLKGGAPVFVKVLPDKAIITLIQDDPTSVPYDLCPTRGRVRFASPDPNKPFNPGDKYRVKVGASCLEVDLTQTI
jgi:hypothetical protein